MIEHSDELAARAERQIDEIAVAQLEGQVQRWREAAGRRMVGVCRIGYTLTPAGRRRLNGDERTTGESRR